MGIVGSTVNMLDQIVGMKGGIYHYKQRSDDLGKSPQLSMKKLRISHLPGSVRKPLPVSQSIAPLNIFTRHISLIV